MSILDGGARQNGVGDESPTATEKEFIAKYFVLLAGDGEMTPWDQLTAEEQAAAMAKHGAFGEACEARPDVEGR